MRAWKPALLLLAMTLSLSTTRVASAEEPASMRRIAFIVGASDGGSERVRLRYAESDARAMASVLETLGGVSARDRLLLLNPTRNEVLDGLSLVRQMLEEKGPSVKRTELFVYYSGHSDEEGLMLGEERVGYAELRHDIESLPADVRVIILDSCASGAITREKGGVQRPPFMVDDATMVEGHAILTSSAANESAQESDRIGGSFFTHYLISGLRGAADTSRDGRVTLNEAYQFAFNETLARTEQTSSGAQHPTWEIKMSGTGDLVMTDLRGSSARLVLPVDMDGRLFVRDRDGHLAAELRKPGGRKVELGLDAGTYTITLIQQDNEAFGSTVTLSDGRRTEVVVRTMEPLSREMAVARGGTFIDPVEETKYIHVPVAGGILPGFSSTSGIQGRIATNVSLNAPFGHVDRVDGVQLGVVSRTTDDVHGVDAAIAGSWISRNVYGVQLSGGFNIAQVAEGVQLGGFNNASSLRGAQVGLINFGGDVQGLQLGLVNIASHASGLQLGLINIADSSDGLSVGIFSYTRQGMLHLDVWTSDSAPINVGIKAGGKMLYTLLALAPLDQNFYTCGEKCDTHPFGSLGVGARIPLPLLHFWSAVDLSGGPEFRGQSVAKSAAPVVESAEPEFIRDFSGLFKLRGMIGWQPYSHFGVFAGIGANAYVTPVHDTSPGPAGWGGPLQYSHQIGEHMATLWPAAFLGIQL